ncbi:MAG: histidine phosphatase family protein [Bacteroidota bacterium]
MVKQLLLIRHGEAQDAQGRPDTERELSAWGYQDMVRVGHYLKEQVWHPDIVFSSTAVRAMSTAQIVAEQIQYATQRIQPTSDLYEASVRTFLSIINGQNEQISRIATVGHNPTLTYLLEYLTGEEVGNIVPGGFALIEFTVENWGEVSQRTGSLVMYKSPTELK